MPVAKLHPPAPGGLSPHLRRPCGAGAPKSHQTLVPLKGRLKTAPWGAMPHSGVETAKRSLVAVLKSLARAYGVAVELTCDAADTYRLKYLASTVG